MAATIRTAQTRRRLSKVHDKRTRIFGAAATLFAEHGFEKTTTQQISDRAEIAAGTLFRYASSKGELLLMVYNEDLRAALDLGEQNSARIDDPVAAVWALLEPILAAAARNTENTIVYQRELLFGSHAEQYRAEGLALVDRLETAIAAILTRATRESAAAANSTTTGPARLASRSIFAVLHLALAQPATGAHPGHDARADLYGQTAQIIAGFCAGPTNKTALTDNNGAP
ncbi:TetR/AcrR family transcriptional regulator [Nocardia huaxiensis]|uniref:TetR/AcrR family transcriptional regulator n=1 Tax=Nocardia huaxiensis TaxID=2755382 RepID=UPI001E3A2CDD|nr:TetR/AcrR family transcriptional regulator [Nocardia huaxiensis]UFS95866.1 TetR/AcrR family transcriptional regulator [Nocardia huaxiensis]